MKTENIDFVKCQICGKETKSINHLHLKKHGISFEEYVQRFPDAKTCASVVSEARNKKLKGREVTWADKISAGNKKSWQENPNQGRTDKPLSENGKKALSEALRGHIVSEETRAKISATEKGRVPWNYGLKKANNEIMKSISNQLLGRKKKCE